LRQLLPTEGEPTPRLFEEFLRAECKLHPVWLVLEDLHFADQPTAKLIGTMLQTLRDAPLFVLAFARPEIHSIFPKLWAEGDMTEVKLGPLPKTAAERFVQEVAMGALGDEDVAQVVRRARGNPSLLKELAVARAAGEPEIPDLALADVEARLDDFEPSEARIALRAASIFGSTFWRGGVIELTGLDAAAVDRFVARATALDVVRKEDACRFPGDEEYRFVDEMLQAAAYASLSDRDLEIGHELASDWLERVGEPDEAIVTGHREKGSGRRSA
jgi:predicted ATPase